MVGRRALNAKIGVRIPASEQKMIWAHSSVAERCPAQVFWWARSSVVERCPDKTEVEGSIPSAPIMFLERSVH